MRAEIVVQTDGTEIVLIARLEVVLVVRTEIVLSGRAEIVLLVFTETFYLSRTEVVLIPHSVYDPRVLLMPTIMVIM